MAHAVLRLGEHPTGGPMRASSRSPSQVRSWKASGWRSIGRQTVADRLESVLFAHPLAGACFEALSVSATLHDAIEAADPQAADLLQRLTVEETDADADDGR